MVMKKLTPANSTRLERMKKALADDLASTLQSLGTNTHYNSQAYRIFKPKQGHVTYDLNNLTDLLLAVQQGTVKTSVIFYTHGSIEEFKRQPETADRLQGASAINLRDFIYACCQDKAILDEWSYEIMNVIMCPSAASQWPSSLLRTLYHIHHIIQSAPSHCQKVH